MLCYKQDIAQRREGAIRGCMTLDQMEHFHFITESTMKQSKRPRLHVAGQTTAGTVLGPMKLPNLGHAWVMQVADKKKMYGSTARILPGGPCPVPTDATSAPKRTDETFEPVSWHGSTKQLWEELLNHVGVFKPKNQIPCIIDLTLGDGVLATLALEHGIPYLGVAFTQFHADKVRQKLVQEVFQMFMDVQSPLHKPVLLKLLQNVSSSTPASSTVPNAVPPKLEQKGVQPGDEQKDENRNGDTQVVPKAAGL